VASSWQTNNEHYLAIALTWLRLRLTQLAENSTTSPAAGRRLFPSQSATATPAEIEQAGREMATAAAADPPPALVALSQQFGLSAFEQSVLLLCLGMELDTRIADLCARAQDDPNRRYPTLVLALTCFDQPTWDVLSPDRPLRYWRLVEIHHTGTQPLTTSPLRADDRLVNYIKGLNHLDDRLSPLLMQSGLGSPEIALPLSQQAVVAEILHRLQQITTWDTLSVIQLVGADSLSKQLVAQQAIASLGWQFYRLPVDLLPTQMSELATLARLWQRESWLLPAILYLDADEMESSGIAVGAATPLNRFLTSSQGLFFLATREIRQELRQFSQIVDVHKPTASEQKILWSYGIGAIAPDSPPLLATQFNLNAVTIQTIAQRVLAEERGGEGWMGEQDSHPATASLLHHRLWSACLAHTRPQMDALAQRIDPRATWDDLVLPAEDLALLHQIADQVRQRHKVYLDWGFQRRMNRGLGINALFAGESGTGKTMAAEVIANDLRLHLYRIDLSAVVNKYIGETEKNLRRLFDAAEDGGAILFFDEADALFGKRSEVKDSHDRYANIEINYLLQRMESYRGLAILATNMKNALDNAFLRRLRFIINFQFPSIKERKLLWQKAFPPEAPVDSLDIERLASFNLTGGNIHSIALNAAFLAAQASSAVTMPLVLAAIRTEYRKLDRPINEADFRS
jgi:hypothetical protein